jgi:type I restriction-modification system DNA methylase subunit
VLFRGGEEKTIRAGLIKDDLLEAVIDVAPNLFYGTGIPACILVLRQQVHNGANRVSGKPQERQGKVLFINADREFFEGRAQNYLLPEHIEKIVTTFDEFRAIPGFSVIVDNATLKANDVNLNIRRYAESEQTEIGQRLESIEARLQHESRSRDKLLSDKVGLMDDLLTGRVRVTPLLAADQHDGST